LCNTALIALMVPDARSMMPVVLMLRSPAELMTAPVVVVRVEPKNVMAPVVDVTLPAIETGPDRNEITPACRVPVMLVKPRLLKIMEVGVLEPNKPAKLIATSPMTLTLPEIENTTPAATSITPAPASSRSTAFKTPALSEPDVDGLMLNSAAALTRLPTCVVTVAPVNETFPFVDATAAEIDTGAAIEMLSAALTAAWIVTNPAPPIEIPAALPIVPPMLLAAAAAAPNSMLPDVLFNDPRPPMLRELPLRSTAVAINGALTITDVLTPAAFTTENNPSTVSADPIVTEPPATVELMVTDDAKSAADPAEIVRACPAKSMFRAVAAPDVLPSATLVIGINENPPPVRSNVASPLSTISNAVEHAAKHTNTVATTNNTRVAAIGFGSTRFSSLETLD
jgi:hypothetical protein